jgi:small-conductance mechanosensitive channel
MEWRAILSTVREILDLKLFTISGTPLTIGTLLTSVAIVAVSFWVSRALQAAAGRFLNVRAAHDEGTIGVTKRLIHYTTLLVGFGVAIHTLGINLSSFFAAGAIFAVGLGFATQNIASNFVSGVILLGERSIKPGDILEIDGNMVRVREMGIRATVVRTLDDEDLIVPNSLLGENSVMNYTLRDSLLRLRVQVGVSYESDMHQVREVLEQCTDGLSWRSRRHPPVVLMDDFGSSSVDFEVSVWIDDPWQNRRRRSDLREAIWWALKDAGITIAFPQVDVHFDEPVVESLRDQRVA